MNHRTLVCVRRVFRWVQSEDLIDKMPATGIRTRAVEKPRERILDGVEIKKFWTVIAEMDATDAVVDALRLCLFLGQRVGEITGAGRSEFDLSSALWTMPAERTKNGRTHTFPLPVTASKIVEPEVLRPSK